MPTTRETILSALHALLQTQPARYFAVRSCPSACRPLAC